MIKKYNDTWLPTGEQDKIMTGNGVSYQANKFNAVIKRIPPDRRKRAIDIGAHCGLWTTQMGRFFSAVECFEPVPVHIQCWKKNIGWKLSCHLHEVALGEKQGEAVIKYIEGMSGRSRIDPKGDIHCPVKRLDDYQFQDVDFIKVDVEGYELFALRGGEQTILEHKPLIIVEQKPQHGGDYGLSATAAVDYLIGLGMKMDEEIVGDFIMVW